MDEIKSALVQVSNTIKSTSHDALRNKPELIIRNSMVETFIRVYNFEKSVAIRAAWAAHIKVDDSLFEHYKEEVMNLSDSLCMVINELILILDEEYEGIETK